MRAGRSAAIPAALAIVASFAFTPLYSSANMGDLLPFSEEQREHILSFGPWPPPIVRDPSNRVSGSRAAAEFGRRLFFEPRLAANNRVACVSCHMPPRAFTDGRAVSRGLAEVDRNSPSILDARFRRWFGWSGASDSLWAASFRAIVDPREMGGSAERTATLIRTDAVLAQAYERAFGAAPPPDDERVLVDTGKALAAFQEFFVSRRTPFDEFRDALERGDREAQARYPLPAQRGLALFIGRANCAICHSGPQFTNNEFHETGVPYLLPAGRGADSGRHGGIRELRSSRFNLLGPYNDDPARATATSTAHVVLEHRNFGEFRTPTLRGLTATAPYMHAGSHPTLESVVRHYSELDESRLHLDGERILRRLGLSDMEVADLVAFLRSLSPLPPARPSASGTSR